jgi:hypothetical protein
MAAAMITNRKRTRLAGSLIVIMCVCTAIASCIRTPRAPAGPADPPAARPAPWGHDVLRANHAPIPPDITEFAAHSQRLSTQRPFVVFPQRSTAPSVPDTYAYVLKRLPDAGQ